MTTLPATTYLITGEFIYLQSCANCPFATKSEGNNPIVLDPDQMRYDCSLVPASKIWARHPVCDQTHWQRRAIEELAECGVEIGQIVNGGPGVMDNLVGELTAVKPPMSDNLFELLFGTLPTDEQPGHWGILSREMVAAMGHEDDPRINIKVDTARMEMFVEQLAERVALKELTPQEAKAEMVKFVEQMNRGVPAVAPDTDEFTQGLS